MSFNLCDKQLEEFDVDTLIDKSIDIKTITKLGLGNNMLSRLPSKIVDFKQLQYLNIRSNQFRQFPSTIFQLPCLEILDISRNKITSFPDTMGKLMGLKVLSVAKNRIDRLPAYIAQMKELRVLKVEGNPLQYPPKNIVHQPAEMQHDEWLANLKQFLQQADTGQPKVFWDDGTKKKGHIVTHAQRPSFSGSELSSSALSAVSVDNSDIQKRLSELVIASHSPEDYGFEFCKGIAFALANMQTALNTLKLFGLDRLVDDAFHSQFSLFIKQNHQLVSLLLETKSRNANFQTVQHKQLIQSSVSAALRLDEYLYSSSDTITNQLDYRCIRKFIFSWHHSNLEIRESIDSLEAYGIKFEVPLDWNLASPPSMVVKRHAKHASVSLSSNSGSSPSATPPSKQAAVSTVSSHSIRPTSASSIGGRSDVVLKIRQVSTSAERATSDSFQVLTCIEKSFKDQDNTLPPSAKEGWESMRRQIRTCREQAMRLQRAIHALNQNIQFEESRNVKRLQLEAGTFIGGITSLTSLARNISKEFQFDKDSLAGLQALTRSTKNLALALKAAAEDAI